jgi:VHL beta domain
MEGMHMLDEYYCENRWSFKTLFPLPPEEEKRLRSMHSHFNAHLAVTNHTGRNLKIFWLDFDGQRQDASSLPSFGRMSIQTYSTHPFLVTEENGTPLSIFLSESGQCVAYVGDSEEKADSHFNSCPNLLEPMPLVLEANLRSTDGDVPVSVLFVNDSDEDLKLLWLDYSGRRTDRGHLPAKGSKQVLTFATHPFVVLSEDLSRGRIFVVEKGYCVARIDDVLIQDGC